MAKKVRQDTGLEDKLDEKERGCDFSLHKVSRFLQPSILLFLNKRPSYGYELIERLKDLGFHKESIDVGAVYRTLRKLEKEGFLESSWELDKGRKRRIYRITPNGRALLDLWIERIEERKKALERFLAFYRRGKL